MIKQVERMHRVVALWRMYASAPIASRLLADGQVDQACGVIRTWVDWRLQDDNQEQPDFGHWRLSQRERYINQVERMMRDRYAAVTKEVSVVASL